MAVIQRADGTQFVIRCYRETLSLSNITLFKQHAFLISEMHGYFSKFLPAKGKNVESVFSTDAGFLLAEMVWYHFDKPSNMIFCEKLDNDHYITVIVRDELIYTDGNLEQAELLEELAAASINMQSAPVYLFGEIPGFFRAAELENAVPLLNFNPKNVTMLPQSLFSELKADPVFELDPIQQAISDLQLSKASKRNLITLGIIAAVIVIAVAAYFILAEPEPQPQQIDPLINFSAGLESPAPQQVLSQIAKGFVAFSTIPGWQASKMEGKGSSFNGTANSYGGSAAALLAWAKQNNVSVKFTSTGAEISMTQPSLPNRAKPKQPVPMQKVVAAVIDITLKLFPDKALSFGAYTMKGAYSTQVMSIKAANASPATILLLGSFLNSLPLTVDAVRITNASNLINATIDITLYGT